MSQDSIQSSVGSGPRTVPPFRADHVGSLLRPESLRRAREQFKSGQIDRDALRKAEDAAVIEAIQLQQSVGLRSVTDGEFRRASWRADFLRELDGVESVDEPTEVKFRTAEGSFSYRQPGIHVTGKLGVTETIFGEAFRFLQEHALPGQIPKLTIPSPSMLHYRHGGSDSIVYPPYADMDLFWNDLAAAYAKEVRGLYELGCRYLQLDDTSLAYINDPAQRQHLVEIGADPMHQHERYISVMNAALAERPSDLVITTHLCRGNNQSMWAAEGGYDFVAEALFGDLDVDGYFLEFDDERSGTFEPLRFVPPGKLVVLGLVTTKRPELEGKDLLKRRIEEASQFVSIDQLCLSGQCGFSSTEAGNKLTIDDQRAKLELVVEVAEEVWGA